MPTAIVIGASSGIGAALARRLVAAGWTVIGMARRVAPPELRDLGEPYRHVIADVCEPDFTVVLEEHFVDIDACIYCTGIGEMLELPELKHDREVFATNLVGMVAAAEIAIPRMIARGAGHFVGLSSQADRMTSDDAPSYAASKAGMSSYLEGLAYACKGRGVAVTNIRFGFVDTAMAKSSVKPFMITADKAARVVEKALAKRPIRLTHPWRMAALLWLIRWPRRIRTLLS